MSVFSARGSKTSEIPVGLFGARGWVGPARPTHAVLKLLGLPRGNERNGKGSEAAPSPPSRTTARPPPPSVRQRRRILLPSASPAAVVSYPGFLAGTAPCPSPSPPLSPVLPRPAPTPQPPAISGRPAATATAAKLQPLSLSVAPPVAAHGSGTKDA